MKKTIWFTALICLLVCMMVITFSGCGAKKDDGVDVKYISAKLEGISELATAKMSIRGIIHVTEGKIPLINKKEFYMIYGASVKAGFDLGKTEIQITEDEVKIILPEVMLLDVSVDENSLEFFDKSDSIFNREDMEDTAEAIAAAKEDVLAQPEVEELKKTAVEHVKVLLNGLLENQVGERKLVVTVTE